MGRDVSSGRTLIARNKLICMRSRVSRKGESRHTCAICKSKRYRSAMVQKFGHWFCHEVKNIYKWNWKPCSEHEDVAKLGEILERAKGLEKLGYLVKFK